MHKATVLKAAGNLYKVITDTGIECNCRVKGKLRTLGLRTTNPVTVGDRVAVQLPASQNEGQIVELYDRRNYIVRRPTNLSKQYHVIAANIDQTILIVTLKEPETNTDFIDRYLVSAESFRIPAILVFNKCDLYTGPLREQLNSLIETYKKIGYNCIETSVETKYNINLLNNILTNKITVVSGNSGVGKSSLIKAIQPDLDLKIGQISDYHKSGMHTTSFSEMFKLNNGGYIIDTPGIKAFGLVDFYKEELYHYFPEIFKTAEGCKFYNCTHIHEPGCAVMAAVKTGQIALSRYTSYYNMFTDENGKYR